MMGLLCDWGCLLGCLISTPIGVALRVMEHKLKHTWELGHHTIVCESDSQETIIFSTSADMSSISHLYI